MKVNAPAPPLARPEIRTARLRLVAGDISLAAAVCAFQRRNREHLAPWDPPTAASFFTHEAQAIRIQRGLDAFQADTAYRYWLLPAHLATDTAPALHLPEVIGSIHFSQVSRGAFQNASLGYALDARHVGRGLMTEALAAGLAEMFSPRVNLHRIQAAYRPENDRSAAVLARLGFRHEGTAPAYLFIDGAWRDHHVTALLNPAFVPPATW